MRLCLLPFLMFYISERMVSNVYAAKLANYTVVGKPTTIKNYPSLVYLGRCVGVLVSRVHILTAGHCIHLDKEMFPAYIGNTKKLFGNQQTIVKVYRHPKFTRDKHTANYDMALLKIKTPVNMSDYVQISEMASSTDVFAPGTLCTVAGWGSLSRSKLMMTSHLHNAIMKIAEPSECVFSRFNFDVESEMCVKSIPGVNQAAAPGDSGAPLWCPRSCDHKLVIAGVDSRGILPDLHKSLDIFTKVSYHRNWINHFMETDQ